MKVSLLLPEGSKAPESLPAFARDALRADLRLDALLDSVSGGDRCVREAWEEAMLSPLRDPALLEYRHRVLADAERNREAVWALYDLCREAEKSKGSLSTLNWQSNYDANATFKGALGDLSAHLETLGKLRQLGEKYSAGFQSQGFRALFEELRSEVTDEYLADAKKQLSELSEADGFLLGVRLGPWLQGADYVLQRRSKKLLNLDLAGSGTYKLGEKDDAARDISARQARAVNAVTDALARSALYLAGFFHTLRMELAFYVGCLVFSQGMREGMHLPVCIPEVTEGERSWKQLYDVSLVVRTKKSAVGNDHPGAEASLWLITGPNQGGKTTFLRSLGLGQLMAQCGMPVGAESFRFPLRGAVFSHFKREEDRWMESGKLDEELGRLRRITDAIRPGGLLLMNESLASTGEREASLLLGDATRALTEAGVEIFSVTHLHTYAAAFQGQAGVQFLRAERREDGSRSFRILPGQPLDTAFGEDLYREVFG